MLIYLPILVLRVVNVEELFQVELKVHGQAAEGYVGFEG
jgi:hypothetical protein